MYKDHATHSKPHDPKLITISLFCLLYTWCGGSGEARQVSKACRRDMHCRRHGAFPWNIPTEPTQILLASPKNMWHVQGMSAPYPAHCVGRKFDFKRRCQESLTSTHIHTIAGHKADHAFNPQRSFWVLVVVGNVSPDILELVRIAVLYSKPGCMVAL